MACCQQGSLTAQRCSFSLAADRSFVHVSGVDSVAHLQSCSFSTAAQAAITAEPGSTITATDAAFMACGTAVAASNATVKLDGSTISHSRIGAELGPGCSAALTKCTFVHSLMHAISASGASCRVAAVNCTSQHCASHHIACHDGAAVQMQQCAVEHGAADGMYVSGESSSAVLASCTVASMVGNAAAAFAGASTTMQGSNISACHMALSASGQSTNAQCIDCSFKECAGALRAAQDAHVQVSNCSITDILSLPALHGRSGAHLHTSACNIMQCAQGCVAADSGASAKVEDLQASSCSGVALRCSESGSHLSARGSCLQGHTGTAVVCSQGATAAMFSCNLIDTQGLGAVAAGAGSVLDLSSCNVSQTGQHAVMSSAQGKVRLQDTHINATSAGCGVLACGGEATIKGGSVSSTHSHTCQASKDGSIACHDIVLEGSVSGSGVLVEAGGRFEGHDVTVKEHALHGVLQLGKSHLELARCRCILLVAISHMQLAAFLCRPGTCTLVSLSYYASIMTMVDQMCPCAA